MSGQHVEVWDIDKIIPYEANAKIHSKEQVRRLAISIKQFGWTQPIVVWENGEIIAGHGRRLAAIELGLSKVPVFVRRDLSKAEADALRLADNRVASTDYDQAALQAELQRLSEELADSHIELTDIGFDEKELNFALSNLGEIDDGFFVEDVSEAVEEQKKANEKSIEATDDIAAPIADAFGFKRVSIAQSRTIRELMNRVEAITGAVGADALITHLSNTTEGA